MRKRAPLANEAVVPPSVHLRAPEVCELLRFPNMHRSPNHASLAGWPWDRLGSIVVLVLLLLPVAGCSRAKYRLAADHEAYETIAERRYDPLWPVGNLNVDMDQRSRFFDPYDPDCSPMPPDDPAAHRYMEVVNGIRGWKHWEDYGDRVDLENPSWREALAGYINFTDEGEIELDIGTALKLAYLHSPSHQSQLETLYLTALDVTGERFRLDTQFFAGYDVRYAHQGALIPPALRFDPTLNRFVVNPAIQGVETNRLTLGRPFGANPALLAQRRFATAGELLVGFANSFVFEFTGGNANLSTSLANFSFIQPLLRGAGKDVALEQLTLVERRLLASLRAYSQYRQGFYTQVAIGELGVNGPQRSGTGTSLTSFSGQGGLGGYIGLLQQRQQIRNSEDNLTLQERTFSRLVAFREAGLIDLVQVEQFRQSVQRERANLLQTKNAYELALDRYKTGTLGLPPDVSLSVDESFISQFQLIPRESTAVQELIVSLQEELGDILSVPENVTVETLQQFSNQMETVIEPVRVQLDYVREDLIGMDRSLAERTGTMTESERAALQIDRENLEATVLDLEQKFEEAKLNLETYRAELSPETLTSSRRRFVTWLNAVLRIVERSVLVQARARLEAVSVETIELQAPQAYEIALAHRLDFMNGRAALVDQWRLIQFNADALQSVLDLTASGELRTARNNPVSFRAPTGTLRLGLEFDAPLTRLLERNAYRESLIQYQSSRRAFIQSQDSLYLGLRALIRDIERLRLSLEIQRQSVAIAIGRVDLTQSELAAPQASPRPGQPAAQFGPTAAINLLSALSDLRDSQNNFLGVYLNYYAARMRLARELGIMTLDEEGGWLDYPIPSSIQDLPHLGGLPEAEVVPLPPALPHHWMGSGQHELSPPGHRAGAMTPITGTPSRDESLHRLPPPVSGPVYGPASGP